VSTLEQVLEQYPDDVKVVFKNFPLRKHKIAKKAAVAALAAGRQGKFWEFHDRLFDMYNNLDESLFTIIAAELMLNAEQFAKDMADPLLRKHVTRDFADGRKIGVRGTPTVFINGRKLKNRSIEGFQKAIEKELKKSGEKKREVKKLDTNSN